MHTVNWELIYTLLFYCIVFAFEFHLNSVLELIKRPELCLISSVAVGFKLLLFDKSRRLFLRSEMTNSKKGLFFDLDLSVLFRICRKNRYTIKKNSKRCK